MADYVPLRFRLPPIIQELVAARNKLKRHYESTDLEFTFDGKFVGDIGEAIASEIFGLRLSSQTGIDGYIGNLSVQVKATGRGLGPAFRCIDTRAAHLLFFSLKFDECEGSVIFNGPEHIALRNWPERWSGQKSLTMRQIRMANELVEPQDRLTPCANFLAVELG